MPVGADWHTNFDVGNCLDVLGMHPTLIGYTAKP